MKKELLIICAIAVIAAAMSIPAFAQVTENSTELGIHGGLITGGDLTKDNISGDKLKLDNAFAWGVDGTYNFTPHWAAEGRYTWDMSKVKGAGDSSGMNVHMFDVNAVYHFNPEAKLVYYGTAGIGWALADMKSIDGTLDDGTPVTVKGDNGFTANAGGGLKYYMTDNIILRADIRYRYMGTLATESGRNINGVDVSGGVAYKF